MNGSIFRDWNDEQFTPICHGCSWNKIIAVFIQVSIDLTCTEAHKISHESAAASKKKMAAGKSYYRY